MGDAGRPPRKVRRDKRRRLRKIRSSKYVHWVIRATLGTYLKWRFRTVPENDELVKKLEPPYIIMGNHGCVWDPFLLNAYVPAPIHYVVSDSNFRSRLVSFGLSLVGSIPKTKALSDFETVKNIVKIKHRKGIIGIFPEGQSSWDGHSLPIYFSTAKLVKSLKVPVVVVELKGGFLSRPRWARTIRRGRVHIEYKLGFRPEDLTGLSVPEIYERLVNMLSHDDFAYQRRAMIRFGGTHRAEYLEAVLFTCPRCETRHSLRSSRNLLRCTNCAYTVRYNAFGFFEPWAGTLRFDNVRSWNVWQIERFTGYLDAGISDGAPPAPLMHEADIRLFRGFKSTPLQLIDRGSLELHPGEVRFTGRRRGTSLTFLIHLIEGANIQNGEPLEFYYQGDMYRVTIPSPRGNTYKWLLAIDHLQGKAVIETTEISEQSG
ncbi:MAG: lysophospholipid acyltransferase family protein [Spirochaetaceae bacterium]